MAITDLSSGNKKCSKCGEVKPLDMFYKCNGRGNRIPYSSSCKECRKKFQKENKDNLKVPCPTCGVKISSKSRYCRECYHKSDKGLENHRKMSERRKALKTHHFCLDCGKQIHRQSKRCKLCKGKGSKNPNWNGGVSSLKKLIMSSYKYREWRSDVYTRDDFTCSVCGVRGAMLHAHHIERFGSIVEKNKIKTVDDALNCSELWNINNGITMCVYCHNNFHKTKGYFYGEHY